MRHRPSCDIGNITLVFNFESDAIPTETTLPLFFVLLITQFNISPPTLSIDPAKILLLSIFSATQDICVDALRIELVDEKEIGEASALYTIGYRVGAILLSQVLTFYIAESYGWNVAYGVMALLFFLFSLIILYILPEPEREIRPYISLFEKPTYLTFPIASKIFVSLL